MATAARKPEVKPEVKPARQPAKKSDVTVQIRADDSAFRKALNDSAKALDEAVHRKALARPKESAAQKALTFHPKVTSGGLGGAIAVVVLYCLATYAHQDFPSYVAAAITTIVTTACGWLAPADPSA